MTLSINNTLTNFDPSKVPFEKAFVLTQNAIQTQLEIALILVSQDRMFQLNNDLRGKPSATDVLSLPLEDNEGEVFICPDYIFSQGYDLDRITHLWIHGLLHIAGYTHDGDDDFEVMSQLESQLCLELGLADPYQ